jgi:hypothetical protein
MELLNVLKLLWRRRFVVGLGAVVAVLVGAAASGVLPIRSAAGESEVAGEALARVLVDTPDPLAGTVQPTGADTIQRRTVLLADLMTSDRMKSTIAKRAGRRAGEVVVVELSDSEPTVPGELPERAATAATTVATERYVLDVRTDAAVPIISIGASAPDARSARILAEEAVDALRSVTARPSGRKAGVEVQPLGVVRAREVAGDSDPRVRVGLAAATLVFAMWCGAVVVACGLARMWRSAGVRAAGAVR